jgi:hypothetical protein
MSEFVRIPVLDAIQCLQVRDAIHANRHHWTSRIPQLPFYTLGVASYLDAEISKAHYYRSAHDSRPLLWETFGWLYEIVASALSTHFKQTVVYDPAYALPGFHIFLAHPAFIQAIAAVHWDAQHLALDWSSQTDFARPVSFTLPITLPSKGAGLNYWDYEWQPDVPADAVNLKQILSALPTHNIEYAVGEMVVHSGRLLHQIAPAHEYQPQDERITLQGHALLSQGDWKLYW